MVHDDNDDICIREVLDLENDAEANADNTSQHSHEADAEGRSNDSDPLRISTIAEEDSVDLEELPYFDLEYEQQEATEAVMYAD